MYRTNVSRNLRLRLIITGEQVSCLFLSPGVGLQRDKRALCSVRSSRTPPNAQTEAAGP